MDAALVILDGWGEGDHDRRNAVETADTPTVNRIRNTGASGLLSTSGRDVGLPEGQMGNSEVGHLNIGAGRVVRQPFTRIEDAIDDGSFFSNDALLQAIEAAKDGRLHLLGLVSEGGVHSHGRHLKALCELAARHDVEAVTHAFLDGRDTPPTSARDYLESVHDVINECGTGDIVTVAGRYFAMDRDENWERTKRAYDAIVNREADHVAKGTLEAIDAAYDRGETDEFVEPTVIEGQSGIDEQPGIEGQSGIDEQPGIEGQPGIEAGDAAIFFNFRPDRARQLVRMLTDTDPAWEPDITPPPIELVTMTEYDEDFPFPVAFPPDTPSVTLGSVLEATGHTQLRIAESEKYPHVTYFLNGGREGAFDGERRTIVDSPAVPTYDQRPEMSAAAVTDEAIEIIEREDPDVLVLNYANPDMVGHTGDFAAAVAACEAVDTQLDRLLSALDSAGADVIVTADHGNAEDMGTAEDPHTAHTTNPVPVVYLDTGTDPTGGYEIKPDGRLADLAPTLLARLDVTVPPAMAGSSLLVDG